MVLTGRSDMFTVRNDLRDFANVGSGDKPPVARFFEALMPKRRPF